MASDSHSAYLVFAAGPVQGFVAQARRTRDLWAGSWLLSHLSESALAAAEKVDGKAIVPHRGRQAGRITTLGQPIGGYPNRFELGCTDRNRAAEAGAAAVDAFHSAWLELCNKVWRKFVRTAAEQHGRGTETIWKRQVENFWELSWVVADTREDAGRLAAARKSLRNVPATVEPGFKCSLMGTLQELSGHFGRGSGAQRDKFWEEVRAKTSSRLDIGEAERLCAIALVKRLYPRVVSQLEEGVAWPSTSFISTLPWLRRLRGGDRARAQAYVEQAKSLGVDSSEGPAARDAGVAWADVDAQVWFRGGVERNDWGLDGPALSKLTVAFKELQDSEGQKPIPFYGLLVMDGDSLGKLLQKLGDPSTLSQGLGRFSKRVRPIVKEGNGRTIYAGGDDVLAMVAAENAVETAAKLAEAYRDSFRETPARDVATLSGAIVFAPLHAPFQGLIRQGHQLLDEVAKEMTGRNSLAIDIVLGSGLSARWSAPWPVVLGTEEGSRPGLPAVLERFRKAEERDEQGRPCYNASFLYNLHDQFLRLLPGLSGKPGEFGRLEADETVAEVLTDIAHAEYRRRLSAEQRRVLPPEATRPQIQELMWLSRRWRRLALEGSDQSHRITCDKCTFSFDGWRVARFLQQVKRGDMGEHH